MNWLKVNFAVAFTAWIHIKALRTFIESVLRYGLPVNFQAAIVKVGFLMLLIVYNDYVINCYLVALQIT